MVETLSLTREAWQGEIWRLWSGHVAHWSVSHLLLNVLAALPVVILGRELLRQLAIWSIVAAPLVSMAMLIDDPSLQYRGASGLVLGGWYFVGLLLLRRGRDPVMGAALLLLATVKLWAEFQGSMPAFISVPSSFSAHLAGSILGILGAVIHDLVAGREHSAAGASARA